MKKVFFFLLLLLPLYSLPQSIDLRLLDVINPNKAQRNADFFVKGISSSSYIIGSFNPMMCFTIGLLKGDKELKSNAIQMGLGIGISMGIAYGFKYAVNRDRPYETYSYIFPKSKSSSPSFPSGHATSAFETATSLSLNFPKWYVVIPTYIWAGAVGYSRMYLGMHYPSDVLASAVIGCGTAWFSYKVHQRIQRKKVSRMNCIVD